MKSSMNQSTRTFPRIPVIVFIIFTIGIISVAYHHYKNEVTSIRMNQEQNLAAIADLKVGQIVRWLDEREGDAVMIQENSAIARLVKNYIERKTQERELTRWIDSVCIHNGYASATIYDTRGTVRYMYGPGGETIGEKGYERIHEVMQRQHYGMSDLHISDVTKKVTIGFIIPLILWEEKDHPTIGALFFRIDPYRVLYPLIQSWPTPSRTAETLLVRQTDGEVVFLNELRHQKDTALKLRFPLTRAELPASLAAQGIERVMEGIDYRGVPVLAVTRKVPKTAWALVTKVDQQEIYRSLQYDQWTIISIVILIIVASGAVLGLGWRHNRSRHYRQLYRAEVERQALLKHFDYLVKYANDIIILFDGMGKVVEVNDQACVKYGYPREELLQMHIRDFRMPDKQSDLPELFEEVVEGEGMVYETRHVRKDGTTFPVEVSARFFAIDGNKHLQTIIRDITERKLAEAALRESEERFRKIFDESPLGMATSGSDYRFLNANEAFCRTFGYSTHELTALTFKDLTHPDHIAQDTEQIRKLLAGEIPVYQTDKKYVRKDRQIIWGRLKVSAMRSRDGRFEHFLIMLEDITAIKEAEKTIAEEKERLLVTLRSIGDGVITTDRQGRITLVNKVAEKLTGWSFDDALGKPLAEVFHIINELTREQCENPVEKVLKSGSIVGLANHTALIRRDGTEMIIADSGAPIRDRESRIIGVVLVFRDITEKEKNAQALQNAQKLEAVGVLAAGIAHDFNNLLGGIFGYLELAREQAECGDGRGAAKTLYKGIGVFDRAKNLTQQLLTFSKGGLPLRKTLSLADHVRKSVSFALSGSNISPVFTIPPDVWLCDFDENQMAQVFDNIAINARQAMPLGGKIEVTVRNVAPHEAPAPLAKNTYVCVSIRDYGVGITKEHLPRIFDPFFTTKQQGNGLGLATSYSIVKNHDGIIEVESAPGKGATFHIYLPASPGQVAVSEKAIRQVHKGEGRILVMDDEEFVLDVATHVLQSMGYVVTAARDGDEAIALTRQAEESGERFSAAILDLTIPGGKGGREIVSELLKIDPKLKAIASSGYSNDPVMSSPADHGFCARLAKPYRKDDLARVLESVLGVSL